MISRSRCRPTKSSSGHGHSGGFTLVELLVSMAIIGFILSSVYMAYRSQERSHDMQEQVVAVQQNLRGAFYMLERDIRMAGYDPSGSGNFGIRADFTGTAQTGKGALTSSAALCFTVDDDEDGTLDSTNAEFIGYRLNGTNIEKFDTGAVWWQDIAENVQALAFAYANDANGDGNLDTTVIGGNVIWAQDLNGDGNWENLDTNDDGTIDQSDDTDSDGTLDGILTGTSINNYNDVRAVMIWILGQSDKADTKYVNTNSYVVGSQVITANDQFRRRLAQLVVKCRNTGL